MYDRLSRWYDLFGSFEARLRRAGLRQLNAAPGEAILEIGAGTGRALVEIATSLGAAGLICGLDRSTGMLTVTRRRLAQSGLTGRVGLTCGDSLQLPYADDCFDGIFMSFTLELFATPEIPLVLAECRRVLCNDGRLCVVAMAQSDRPNAITRMYGWFHEKLPEYVDCRPIYVLDVLRSAGFRVMDATTYSLYGLDVEIAIAQNFLEHWAD